MKYALFFYDKIQVWKLMIISLLCGVFFASINFGFVLGCKLGPVGNKPCKLISHYYNSFDNKYYFSLSIVQLLLMFGFVLFIINSMSSKKNVVWTPIRLSIYSFLSLMLFSLTYSFVGNGLNSVTYESRDGKKFLKDWTVDCNKIVLKTPLFSYDPNEGQVTKTKDLYLCSYDRYSRDHVYDIFGREIKN